MYSFKVIQAECFCTGPSHGLKQKIAGQTTEHKPSKMMKVLEIKCDKYIINKSVVKLEVNDLFLFMKC